MKKIVNNEEIELTSEEEAEENKKTKDWEDGALNRALAQLRLERDSKLAQTDYLALSDNTLADNMKTYRQELRDLTSGLDTVDKVNNVTWPTKPS